MLAEGKRHRERTGQSLMVPRYDIVPIPEHLRGHVVAGLGADVPGRDGAEHVRFPRRGRGRQASRRGRCCCCTASNDSVTPTEQSIEMFERAGQPTELHLFADTDHFMFAESNTRVREVVRNWLDAYFPVRAKAQAA